MNDLVVEQAGRVLQLSFTAPRRATDGRILTKPIGIRILRNVAPPGGTAPRSFVDVHPWVSIAPREAARYRKGAKIVYDDDLSAEAFDHSVGDTFSFRVITFTLGFRRRLRESEPSNVSRTEVLDVSSPVQNLSASQTPRALDVRWSAPMKSLTGRPLPPLAGYRVYRSVQDRPDAFALLAETRAPSYRDTHFEYNRAYIYKVRAVFAQDGYLAETADPAPASIIPRDIFPPNPPVGLTVVYTGRAVEMIWKATIAPGVAGYNVYRQQQGYSPERLNREPLRVPAYSDPSVEPGAHYVYWVTSVDLARNESTPSQKISVVIQ